MALTHGKPLRKTSSVVFSRANISEVNYFQNTEDQGLGRRFLEKLLQNKDKIHEVDATSGITATNGSVRQRGIQLATEMKSRGIQENDIILICSKSHNDQTVAVLATILVGAIVAPLDPESDQIDFKNCVLTLKPKMAFCDLRLSGQLTTIIKSPNSGLQGCAVVVFGEHTDRLAFEKLFGKKTSPDFKGPIVKDPKRKVAFIMCTQRTTGAPKLDFDLSCLKTLYVGGSVTTAWDMTFLRGSFRGKKVLQCYGTTEMSCLVAGFDMDDYESALIRPASVGRLMSGVKYKIADLETRENLGPDRWGELLLSGPTLMIGYKDNSGGNTNMEKSYFKTGDVAQYDSEGYLYIRGRVSDTIMMQGRRYFPLELEELIMTHPYVCEVVVLGNEKELVACVVRKVGCRLEADQLQNYLKDKMPGGKRPTKIKFMDSFPKTTVGKVKRSTMKSTVLGGIMIVQSKSIVSL